MWRNPFAAVLAAVKSLLPKRAPARRTVTLPMPGEAPKESHSNRPRTKHGKRSLYWRRWNRPRRRERLALTWSRMWQRMPHPLAAMTNRAPAHLDQAAARRWARRQLKQARAAR